MLESDDGFVVGIILDVLTPPVVDEYTKLESEEVSTVVDWIILVELNSGMLVEGGDTRVVVKGVKLDDESGLVDCDGVVVVKGDRMTLTFLEIDRLKGYKSGCLLSAKHVIDVI